MIKKYLRIFKKIGVVSLCLILSLILLIIGGGNIVKFVIYSEYYSIKTDICKNPGLSDGFVCQGICVYEEGAKILVSGYMADNSPSRIYVTDTENNSYYVSVTYGSGKDFTGHSGGIAISDDNAYIASGNKIYAIPLSSILDAKNGDSVSISKIIPVNNEASFIYADKDYIYVGEYHDGKSIFTDHPYETPDGTYYAIVSRYSTQEIKKYHKNNYPTVTPNKIYSIRNNAQGICFTPDGMVVISTSYGIDDTVYYVYNESDATDSGDTMDGAHVYYLYGYIQEIKAPAMGEDVDYYNGRIITLTESASNKYMFGKFFFADKIVAIDFE